ncbi:hypothetical protein [Streptomyces sp. SID8377]|uniref:hypothetical protein n=1 Tax=Streptomyces sp. SID8377 TaxID=2690357 RepID=UPI0003A1E0FB|nr:hypothetical protein [Streptomyces sp. SID8377]
MPNPGDDEPPGEELVDDEDQEHDLADDEDAGEESLPGRAFTMPDLRPYLDPRGAAGEMAQLGIDVSRRPARAAGRGLANLLRRFPNGSGVLLQLLVSWLTGTRGKSGGSLVYRLGGAAAVGYCLCRAVALWPLRALLGLAVAWILGAALADRWDAAEAERRRRRGKGKGKAKGKGKPKRPDPEVADEETPADDVDEEEEEEAPEEAVPGPTPEDITKALHALVGSGSGVLFTTLRDHLELPSTKAVKALLKEVGIPSRPGVRAVAGNGPGIHRRDFPVLASLGGVPLGGDVVADEQPTANANNAARGLRVERYGESCVIVHNPERIDRRN